MPRVEGAQPSLIQALVVRLYSKDVRLRLATEVDEEGEGHERIVPRRKKGTDAQITPEELDMVDAYQAQLKTMLRFDRPYAAELIRDVHEQVSSVYPRARGCDLSEYDELMWKAHDALDALDMHGVWYWLDEAIGKGLAICERCKDNDVMVAENARKEALER